MPAVAATLAGALLAARRRLYEGLREEGRADFQCPSCGAFTEDITVPALVVALGGGLPRVFDGDHLEMPSQASVGPVGARPSSLKVAAAVRFNLPSARIGLPSLIGSGTLGDIDPEREVAAWDRHAPIAQPPPDDHPDFPSSTPNFPTGSIPRSGPMSEPECLAHERAVSVPLNFLSAESRSRT
jgi:hypothetical protein